MPTLRALLDVLSPAVEAVSDLGRLDVDVDEVVLLGPGDPLPSNPCALLLCVDASAVAALPSTVAGAVVRTPDAAALATAAVPVLAADLELPWNHLLHLLSSALAPGEGSGDLFSLATSLAAAVGGAVAIEDTRRRVLAYSSLPDQVIDDARRQGILGRQVPDLSNNDRIYREMQRSGGVVRIPGHGGVLPRLAVAVRSGAELLGSVWVVEGQPIPPEREQALLDGARLAALHLLRSRASTGLDRRARGELVRALLDGRSAPDLAGSRLGLEPGTPHVVLGFALPQDVAGDELAADAVADLVQLQCSAVRAGSGVLLQLGTVYALLPAAALSRPRLEQLCHAVIERARVGLHVELRGAVGSAVPGLHAIARSRADVDAVLRLVPPGQSATVEQVLPQVVLLDLQSHLAAAGHLRLPAVDLMLAHDAEHATPYVESVLAYLAANADMPAAAEAVQVHPNTFRYRMRRVRELFDLDLDDPDLRLVVWLQLRTLS